MKKITLTLISLACCGIAAAAPDTKAVNFGSTSVDVGWTTHTQAGGASISVTSPYQLTVSANGGNFNTGNYGTGSTTTLHADVLAEFLRTTGISMTANVYQTGLTNGAAGVQTTSFSGLVANESYTMYVVYGCQNRANDQYFTLDTNYITKAEQYVTSSASGAYSTLDLTASSKTHTLRGSADYVVLKLTGHADALGNLTIGRMGERGTINALTLTQTSSIIPEPSIAAFGLFGFAGLALRRRRAA